MFPTHQPMSGLINLNLGIGELALSKDAEAHFSFTDGDALAGITLDDVHKEKGGAITFTGSTGQQELGVIDHFMRGTGKRVDRATDISSRGNKSFGDAFDDLSTANDNHFDVFNDNFGAFDHAMEDAFGPQTYAFDRFPSRQIQLLLI